MNYLNIVKHLKRKSGAGFTLVELIVVIAIIAILSGIILFTVSQYINRGKDSNISGNLAVLVPAGEAYYNGNTNSYQNFCSSTVVSNAKAQMPINPSGDCYNISTNPSGVCCVVDSYNSSYQSWVACAREFANSSNVYCIDSRGFKEDVAGGTCSAITSSCASTNTCQCP